MAGTTHRKDLVAQDFCDLHSIRRAFLGVMTEKIIDLGERIVPIPTWQKTPEGVYRFQRLKEYRREVYWVPVSVFRRIIKRAGIETGRAIYVLLRFSMLAAMHLRDEERFMLQFSDEGGNPWCVPSGGPGYLVEKRRIVSGFACRKR